MLEPPRGIDPEIQKPVPDDFEGKTPVIPPPGEPGGQQDAAEIVISPRVSNTEKPRLRHRGRGFIQPMLFLGR